MASARETTMRPLLGLSAAIDLLNEKIGYVCNLLVLAACIVSAGNAMIRYAFGYSSNGWLELQWYMFAVLVMFGASYTFKRNEHVRVEILYLMLSERGQLWLDLIGTLFFLIPSCLLLSYLSWPFFHQAYEVGEMSSNAVFTNTKVAPQISVFQISANSAAFWRFKPGFLHASAAAARAGCV